jgi:hypothetical protein
MTGPNSWTRDSILVAGGHAASRHFWSCWMKRALASHEREMATPHRPIAATDIGFEASEAMRAHQYSVSTPDHAAGLGVPSHERPRAERDQANSKSPASSAPS